VAHPPFILLGVVASALGVWVVADQVSVRLPGDRTGYAPEQPIRFSHQMHAGELQIACLYCHLGADRSRHAGVPPTSVCMNCHKFVAAPLADVRAEERRANEEKRAPRPVVSPEIAKLYDAAGVDGAGKPVPGKQASPVDWVRVHDLPDFVFFDHRSHVAQGVACASCHGAVDTMPRVRQVNSLSMGWCVNCHRAANATGLPDGRRAHASTDCSACHY
jgi:hypothetical protein